MTPWLEKKEGWIPSRRRQGYGGRAEAGGNGRRGKRQPAGERVFSVAEVADILAVDKQTVRKWLMDDDETGEAVIPAEAWFKLPNGYIRIWEWIVVKLMEGGF